MDEHDVQFHVSSVYNLVITMLRAYSVGAMLTPFLLQYIVDTFYISTIASICFLFATVFTKIEPKRFYFSLLFSTFIGINSGFMMQYAHYTDKFILPSAIILTIGTFTIFSHASKHISQQAMVLMQGYLCSALWGLVMFGVFTILFPSTFGGAEILYCCIGILVFCGFVTYDTALMYDRIRKGDIDHYHHALNLFLDIVNLFVKIVRILIKLKSKNK